ncbi:hypothetical protein BC828DRAFT_210061 [Blastocladiella britannica]|nr:hypothetical protein BC828DRAFT_210061 [Blastocladiella britannica]
MPQIVTHNPSAFGKSMIAHPSATSLATLASPAVDQIDLTYPTTDSDADDNSKSAAAAGKNRTKRAVEGGSQLSSSPLGSSSSGGGGGGPARLPAPHPPGTARTLPEPIPAAASRKTPWHPTGHRTIGLLPPVPSPGLISLGGSTAVPLPVKRKRTVSAGFLGGGTPRSGAPPPPLTQLPSLSAAGDVAPAPKRMRRSSTIAAMTATTGATTTAVVTASSGGGECGSGPLRSGSPSPTTSSSEQQQGAVPKPARTKRRLRTKDQGGKRQ